MADLRFAGAGLALIVLGGLAWTFRDPSPPPPIDRPAPLGAPSTPAADGDAASFEAAVLAADAEVKTDADVLDAMRRIEAVLRARPAQAGQLSRIFARFKNRGLAFRAALTLGSRAAGDPAVRAGCLAALGRRDGHGPEAAAYTFYGAEPDAEVAEALAATVLDGAAGPRARAAQAFALTSHFPALPAERQAAVRAEARRLAADRTTDAPLRGEALGLLDVKGADRDLLRGILRADPRRSVALQAARLLLTTGEPEAAVRADLSRFADSSPTADLTSRSLDSMLREGQEP